MEEVGTRHDMRLHADRDPDIRRHTDVIAPKTGRGNADYGVDSAMYFDGLAENRRIQGKSELLESVAYNSNRVGA